MSRWIKINCGGQVFETNLETVTKFPHSKLAAMFSTEAGAEVDMGEDLYKLDLEPQCFGAVLTWLRHGILSVPSGLDIKLLLATAKLLGLEELVKEVNREETREARGDITDWLKLNVGGRMFETSRATLTSDSESILARMFQPSSSLPPATLADGVYMIDACPRSFSVIINWLRYRSLILGDVRPEDVLPAADYFGLRELRRLLERQMSLDTRERGKLIKCIDQSTEALEEHLQRQGTELTGIKEKMDQLKIEVSQVVNNVEDIWRVKCEISSLTQCISGGFKKFK